MWLITPKQEQKERERRTMEIYERMLELGKKKREAREAYEANRCPHCGRNDPLPPWLI